jgi:hypothetical protein
MRFPYFCSGYRFPYISLKLDFSRINLQSDYNSKIFPYTFPMARKLLVTADELQIGDVIALDLGFSPLKTKEKIYPLKPSNKPPIMKLTQNVELVDREGRGITKEVIVWVETDQLIQIEVGRRD